MEELLRRPEVSQIKPVVERWHAGSGGENPFESNKNMTIRSPPVNRDLVVQPTPQGTSHPVIMSAGVCSTWSAQVTADRPRHAVAT